MSKKPRIVLLHGTPVAVEPILCRVESGFQAVDRRPKPLFRKVEVRHYSRFRH